MGTVEWDTTWIDEKVREFTNAHAQRLDTIAQGYIGSNFTTSITRADEDSPSAFVTAPQVSLFYEYGDAETDPEPWGIPALMEASE